MAVTSDRFKDIAAPLIIRCMVGVIFVSEGIQKFLYPEELGSGRFAKIGFSMSETLGCVVGATEVICGALVLLGFVTRYSILPLAGIMIMAVISTKVPILFGRDVLGFTLKPLPRYGALSMLHEARTDLCMLCGLLYLQIVGPGPLSLDERSQPGQP